MTDGDMTVQESPLWLDGCAALACDPYFGPWVEKVGSIRFPESTEGPFYYLARSIIYQQLAGAAARTIHERFVEALKRDVTPAKVLRVRETTLRKAGLSGNKLSAIRDLARKVRSGEVCVHDLDEQPDDEVVRRLTLVRGIGPWTAHMYLMFRLRRPDVWPIGDYGVRTGFAKILGLERAPTPKELDAMGERYKPWRSAAAFYCWRALENDLA